MNTFYEVMFLNLNQNIHYLSLLTQNYGVTLVDDSNAGVETLSVNIVLKCERCSD